MTELALHRQWLLSYVGAMLAMLAIAIAMYFDPHGAPLFFGTLFAIAWVAAVVSYIRLIIADTRLATRVGLGFDFVPLWLIYLTTGLGPFISVWLDWKASRLLSRS